MHLSFILFFAVLISLLHFTAILYLLSLIRYQIEKSMADVNALRVFKMKNGFIKALDPKVFKKKNPTCACG